MPANEHVQGAGQAGAGRDYRAKLGTFHQALVSAQIQPAFLIAFSPGYVTTHAIVIKNSSDISLETNLFLRRDEICANEGSEIAASNIPLIKALILMLSPLFVNINEHVSPQARIKLCLVKRLVSIRVVL